MAAIWGSLHAFASHAEATIEESRQIGPWVLSALSEGGATLHACDLRRFFDDGYALGFWFDKYNGWRLTLAQLDKAWQLKANEHYALSYRVDDGPTVAVSGEADTSYAVGIPLGDDFGATLPFKRGRRIRIIAAKASFDFDLAGSSRALDALHDCALRYAGYQDPAVLRDPFSAESGASVTDPSHTAASNPFADTSSKPQAKVTGQDMEPTIDRLMRKLETERLVQLMFRYRPALKEKVRDRLQTLAGTVSPEELERTWSLEAARVLAPEIQALATDAPPDVIYPLIKHQLGVMLALQQRDAQACVDYFVGSGTVPSGVFPLGSEQRELELKADVVQSAIDRPTPIARPVDQDKLIRLIRRAYAMQGYPISEFAKLAQQGGLDADEECRVAIEFTSAVTGLDQSEATYIHKAMSIMDSEQDF